MVEMYGLTVVTPPAAEPVTTPEAKLFCKIEHAVDDDLVAEWIKDGRERAEVITGRQFVTATLLMTVDEFCNEVMLPRTPVQSIASVKYDDDDGTEQTLASTGYRLNASRNRLFLAYNQTWPSVRSQSGAVRIAFVAGYGAAAAVPAGLKGAIKQWVAWMNQNRGVPNDDMLEAYRRMLTPWWDGVL